MKKPRIDRGRLAVLRGVSDRENAALIGITDRMNADVDLSARLGREIRARHRLVDAHRSPVVHADIAAKEAERVTVEKRISAAMQEAEIQRERVQAATRLRRRCEEFVGGQG